MLRLILQSSEQIILKEKKCLQVVVLALVNRVKTMSLQSFITTHFISFSRNLENSSNQIQDPHFRGVDLEV